MNRNMKGLQKPISKFDVGHMSFENRGKAYEA
jgi:hypothetical protein